MILDNSHWRLADRNLYPRKEEQEMFLFLDKLDHNDVFWDIGANIGYFSLYVAKKGIDTVAFEPDSLTCAALNKNIYLNKLDSKVLALPIALNDTEQVSYLNMQDFLPVNAYNTFDVEEDQWGGDLDVSFRQGSIGLTADYIINKSSKNPTALKIDVDGNEYKVLLGMKECLKKIRLLALELGYTHPKFKASIKLIESYGFKEIDDARLFNEKRDRNNMRNFYFEKVLEPT